MSTAPRKRSRMTGSELAKAVAEFDGEFIVDTFGSPPRRLHRGQRDMAVEAYNNTWHRCTPTTTADIRAAEKTLGVKFRPELLRLLGTCANGEPELYWYTTPAEFEGHEWGVGQVLNVKPGDVMSVQTITKSCWNIGLPKTWVAFAADNGNASYAVIDQVTGLVQEFLVSERRLRPLGRTIDNMIGSLTLDFLGAKNANVAVLRESASRGTTQKSSKRAPRKSPRRK